MTRTNTSVPKSPALAAIDQELRDAIAKQRRTGSTFLSMLNRRDTYRDAVYGPRSSRLDPERRAVLAEYLAETERALVALEHDLNRGAGYLDELDRREKALERRLA